MITEKELEKLAELSRIRLSEQEKEEMRQKISAIIGYVDQIKNIKLTSVNGEEVKINTKIKGSAHDSSQAGIMRQDAEPHQSGAYTETILKNAPATKDGYIKVKKIL